ncbi:TIGR03905 family TSCPD domain-containing protein [Caldanaerobius polysaccharolyticus]|uniref:TIGR03905 family TSCPD domain-containing protein n=1 Tax=Caldanaerobius polysaccharolyticus TaxID=44256 RepID=UPI000479B454|nr:TIGR03905 family TSCPD domain-containing protein [Caldanaerobius polysaccharolyticus]
MRYSYVPHGVCCKKIVFDVIDGKIANVNFIAGCKGNLQGLAKLLEGMDVKEATERLKGIKCQGDTSCPDQFAKAVEELVLKHSVNTY